MMSESSMTRPLYYATFLLSTADLGFLAIITGGFFTYMFQSGFEEFGNELILSICVFLGFLVFLMAIVSNIQVLLRGKEALRLFNISYLTIFVLHIIFFGYFAIFFQNFIDLILLIVIFFTPLYLQYFGIRFYTPFQDILNNDKPSTD